MARKSLYPEVQPFRTGRLQVSALHTVFYEEVGNPKGKPAVFLHGGPGVGILPHYRRFFDPKFYRVILPDQRGAGRSTPHAEWRDNTTWDLVEDLEQLRRHLNVERWLVFGGSWGSTLALCYAVSHPERVAGLIIRGVFLGTRREIDWLHRFGASEIWPDEWERYRAPIPPAEHEDLVAAYHRRLTGNDPEVALAAAKAWARWEAATMTHLPDPRALAEFEQDARRALSVARIECHYTLNAFFLPEDDWVLRRASVLKGIPLRIVQGRYDVICPVRAAWELARAVPGAELVIVPDGGHSPLEEPMARELVRAAKDFQDCNW